MNEEKSIASDGKRTPKVPDNIIAIICNYMYAVDSFVAIASKQAFKLPFWNILNTVTPFTFSLVWFGLVWLAVFSNIKFNVSFFASAVKFAELSPVSVSSTCFYTQSFHIVFARYCWRRKENARRIKTLMFCNNSSRFISLHVFFFHSDPIVRT